MESSKRPGGELPIELEILLQHLRRTAPDVVADSFGAANAHQATPVVSPLTSSNEDIIRRPLQERDEFRALYSDGSRDLDRIYLHLNKMQDALTTSENRANTLQTKLNASISRFEGRMSS